MKKLQKPPSKFKMYRQARELARYHLDQVRQLAGVQGELLLELREEYDWSVIAKEVDEPPSNLRKKASLHRHRLERGRVHVRRAITSSDTNPVS